MKALPVLAGAIALSTASTAFADLVELGFTRITANAPVDVASQFQCDLEQLVPGTISFTFSNAVGIQSSISEIYYDAGPSEGPGAYFLGMATLVQLGTNFVAGGANPGDLPGGNTLTPPFVATQIFSADAQGNPANGIDQASDSLQMQFTLNAGVTFQSIVDALMSGDIRIGMHVRSIQGDQSDGFVNNMIQVVPLPPAAYAGGASLLGLALVRTVRRRNAR